MIKRFFILGAVLAALSGAFLAGGLTLGTSFAGSPFGGDEAQCDAETPDDGPQANVKLASDAARTAALSQFPGATVSKVDLEANDGTGVYAVHLTDSTGKGWDVKVDGNSGAVHAEAETAGDKCD